MAAVFGFGMSGQQIYDNFRNGGGAGGLTDSAAMIRELADGYAERQESITRLAARMESAWQGDAAGAAQRGAGPLAVEHGLAAPEMVTAQGHVVGQAGAYERAAWSVVPIPPVPDRPSVWANLISGGEAGRDYQDRLGTHNAATQHNIDVMDAYEQTTDYHASGLPRSYGSIAPDHSAIGVVPQGTVGPTPAWTRPTFDGTGPHGTAPAGGGPAPVGARTPDWTAPAGTAPAASVSAPTHPGSAPHDLTRPVPGGGRTPSHDGPTPGSGPGSRWPATERPGTTERPGATGRGDGTGRPVPGRGTGSLGGSPSGGLRGGPHSGPYSSQHGGPGGRPGGSGQSGARFGAQPAPLGEVARGMDGGPARSVTRGNAGTGAFPQPMGTGAQGEDDLEHRRRFVEPMDGHELFGTDQVTAPPVIG